MSARPTLSSSNVTPFPGRSAGSEMPAVWTPATEAMPQKSDVARYIGDMVLELERLAGTANLELVSYFLAMARAEAESAAKLACPASE